MAGLVIADAPKAETLNPPASFVETPTGVMHDPSKEAPAPEAKKEEQPAAERPAWLPDKFKSAEDMAKAYKELEQKQGKAPESSSEQGKVEQSGVNMSTAQDEFEKDGKLSDATYKSLAAKGLSREIVDGYLAGQKAIATQTRSEFVAIAGSEEQLTAVLEWAKTGLSKEEITAYDSAVRDGHVATAKMLFQNIQSRFTAANGADPKLVTGSNVPGTPGVQPYESWAQVTADMSKREYKEDPAFRKKVEARLAKSNF